MAVIEDPILNSPFSEPTRHFKFGDDGITDEILNGRRPSSHFVPIPRAKKKGKQLQFDTEWTKDRIEPNPVVDRIRQRVGAWRQGGYVGVTGTTSRLLAYWTREQRDKPLFFCLQPSGNSRTDQSPERGRTGEAVSDSQVLRLVERYNLALEDEA